MKKLLFWAVLLMTGFAFYSCDERYDNPATETPNPSDPASTWTYQVKIDFEAVPLSYYDEEEETYKGYENPTTVWVYNQEFEELGFLTSDEDGKLFAGVLKGAIGDTLIISTLENFDYISKQDGTIKSILENCVLQTAKAPIIVANASNGKIGTQSVSMKNQLAFIRTELDGYAWKDDHEMTISSDNFVIDLTGKVNDNTFTLKLDEKIDPFTDSEGFYYAVSIKDENETTEWTITDNSENGYISEGIRTQNFRKGYYYSRWFSMSYLRSIDLTKWDTHAKKVIEEEGWVNYYPGVSVYSLPGKDVEITQSGDDALPISLYVYKVKNITLKDINAQYISFGGSYSIEPDNEYDYRPVVTLEGNNIIGSEDNLAYYGMYVSTSVTFKGTGSLTVDGTQRGIISWSTYMFIDEEGEDHWLPAGITLDDNVTITSKNEVELDGWTSGEEKIQNFLTINKGKFEAIAANDWEAPIYLAGGKITIGTEATGLIAKSNTTYWIYDGSTNDEATLESLVADKTKFNDKTEDKVRTITPKK